MDAVSVEAHALIARFLDRSGYRDSLAAFARDAKHGAGIDVEQLLASECSQPTAAAATSTDIRDLVERFQSASLARQLKPRQDDDAQGTLEQSLAQLRVDPRLLPRRVTRTIRDASNVLSVQHVALPRRTFDSASGRFVSETVECLMTSAVDRTLKFYALTGADAWSVVSTLQLGSPVLCASVHPVHARLLATASMDGSLAVFDLVRRPREGTAALASRKDHAKYVVRCAWSSDGRWLASAGYDRRVLVYGVTVARDEREENALLAGEERDAHAGALRVQLELRREVSTRSNPEAVCFLPDSSELVYACRDDHLLHYLKLPTKTEHHDGEVARGDDADADADGEWQEQSFNLNPNGDHWTSFSVLSIVAHPSLPLLSLQTSTATARLLLYPFRSATRLATLFTGAEQGDFTTPRHAFLPSSSSSSGGTGAGAAAIVSADDGLVRVVDVASGRVLARIGAHGAASPRENENEAEARSDELRQRRETERASSVIKDVCAFAHPETGKMVIASCGFDKTVRVMEAA